MIKVNFFMKGSDKSDIDLAYDKSVEVLEKCSTRHGFDAAFPGYNAIWARDSMIISLGASLIGKKFEKVIKNSIETLGRFQSENGQIPNAIDRYSKRKPHVDFQSIDSTMWFIIGNYLYKNRFRNSNLLKKNKKKIEKGLNWLSCQDPKENSMLGQLPTSDWQDAFPHRYGFTINTEALYYKTLKLTGNRAKAAKLKKVVNRDSDTKLWNGEFYYPWRWKNHNKYEEKGEWFDSLGNLLAIIFELADENHAKKILAYIKKKKIDKPYPIKSLHPVIRKGTKDWQDYFNDCDARIPYHYLNSGVWTFIGGFYVCALVKMKKFKEAEAQLKKLAEANLKEPHFGEWLHGKTGKSGLSSGTDGNQGWNAGMYIVAYESVKKKKCLI